MSYVYPTSITLYCYPSADGGDIGIQGVSTVNLTPDIVGIQNIKRGFMNQSPATRLASPGQYTFTLLNNEYNNSHTANRYSPTHANCLSGFQRGIAVELIITYGYDVVKFYGWITSIKPNYQDGTCKVTCYDELYFVSNSASNQVGTELNKTIYERIQTLSGSLVPSISACSLSGSGGFTNVAIFGDPEEQNQTLGSKINQLITSEMGYGYLVPNTTGSGTWNYRFYVESKDYRGNDISGSQITIHADIAALLSTESEDTLTTESGDPLVVNDVEPSLLNDEHEDAIYSDGLIVNRVKVKYSTTYDWNREELLGESTVPIEMIDTAATPVYVYYSDLEERGFYYIWGKSANFYDAVLSSGSDTGSGSGINLSYWLQHLGTDNYGTYAVSGWQQDSGSTLWLTSIRVSGCAIYKIANGEVTLENTASEQANGTSEISLDMFYRDNDGTPQGLGNQVLNFYKNPRLNIDKVSFSGNINQHLMLLALHLDIGSQIRVIDTKIGVDKLYYIDFIDMNIEGSLLDVTWTLRENCALWI